MEKQVIVAVRNSYLQLVIEMITNLWDHHGKFLRSLRPGGLRITALRVVQVHPDWSPSAALRFALDFVTLFDPVQKGHITAPCRGCDLAIAPGVPPATCRDRSGSSPIAPCPGRPDYGLRLLCRLPELHDRPALASGVPSLFPLTARRGERPRLPRLSRSPEAYRPLG